MQIAPDIRIEAMRLSQALVIRAIKAHGIRVSHIRSSEITLAAHTVLNDPKVGKELIQRAWDICKMRWEAQRCV